jgi:outer membrane protein assembly factor BamB
MVGAALLATSAAAPPTAQFGANLQRNQVNTVDKNVPTEWSIEPGKQKNIKWVAALGTISYGGPVVAGGKVYVGTNNQKPRDPAVKGDKGILMCFNAADGKFLWQDVRDKLPNPQENDWPQQGIASTPAVDGDRLYYVSNRCELVCLTTDGKPAWRLDMMKDLNVFPRYLSVSSPLVVGDLVYTLTSNGVDDDHKVVSPKAPSFLAVDKKTGKVIWSSDAPGDKIMEGQWTNPTYAEVNGKGQVIFPGGDGWLYGFEATTGKPLWKFDCNPKKSEYKPGGRGDRSYFLATPVVYDNKVFIGTGNNPDDGEGVGHLWCIDITKTGDLSPVNDNFDPQAPVNKNSGLVWHYGGKADPKVAAETNRDIVFGRTMSTCAIHDGLLYTAELTGFFHCLDAKTGKKLWDHDLKSSVWGSPYWVDGKVYIGNEDGDVYVFAHGRQKKVLNGEKPLELKRPIKSTPVVVDGTLYIMTDTHLYAIGNK